MLADSIEKLDEFYDKIGIKPEKIEENAKKI